MWIIGLTVAVGLLTRDGDFTLLSQFFSPARDVAIIAIAVWFMLRAVSRIEAGLPEDARNKGRELDPTAADAIGKLVRAAIIITAILVAMQTHGFSISGLLAFGGIGGIAIGFAAQGMEIGRESGRERWVEYVEIQGGGVYLTKTKQKRH